MTENLDQVAGRIADKGRKALIDRLRPAFEEAAAAHADVLELDADKLEQMVQSAADRADGLQWRRALASVATEELGIGLAEALGHPAVARAQTIVGAPSYEESLAAITGASPGASTGASTPEPGAEPSSDAGAVPDAEPEAAAAAEAAAAEPEAAAAAGADAEPEAAAAAGADAEPEAAAAAGAAIAGGLEVSVSVVHLDGLSELDGQEELELRFTEDGLDVVPASGEPSLAHFAWSEINSVYVRPERGRMLRRRGAGARLILSATGRQARFEARGADAEELKQRLAPALVKLDLDT